MPKKMTGQKTTLWWVKPALWTANPVTLDLSDMTTAIGAGNMINFTEAIEAGYTLNSSGSDTDESTSVATEGNGLSRGAANFEADITFFREKDPVTNTDSLFEDAFQLFKTRGVEGYWVQRFGYRFDTALAVGHLLNVYKVVSDYPQDVESDSGGPIRFRVPFGQNGFMLKHTAVVA